LRHWLDNDFKAAVNDDVRVEQKAAWMLKVGHEKGDSAIECTRKAVASFVIDCIAPNAIPSA
jgi:hypothetical protein